jgi:hypothetical protein
MGENWFRGWDWYERLYAYCGGAAARGEASNSYSANESYPSTVARIRDNLPNVKLIYNATFARVAGSDLVLIGSLAYPPVATA